MGVSDERRVSNAGTALSHHSNGTGMSHHSNGGSFDLPPAAAPDGPEPAIYSRSSGGSMKYKRKASLAREGGEVLRWRGKSMKSMGSMNSLAMHGSEAHEDLMDLQPGDALPWLGHDLPMFVPNLDVGDVEVVTVSSSKKQRTPLVIKAAKKNKPKHKTHGMFKPAVGLHGSFSSFHSVISGQSFIGGAPGMPGSRSNESFESAESHDLPEFEHMPEIGLVQISEKIGLDQSSGEAEAIIKTWRIRLVGIMESLWVNLLVLLCVLLDVATIAYFTLNTDLGRDCFGRDFPEQESITIFVLTMFIAELTLRCVAHGPHKFFALRTRNWATWFDITVVLGSLMFAILQMAADRSKQIPCPADGSPCPDRTFPEYDPVAWMELNPYWKCITYCPTLPPRVYLPEDDAQLSGVPVCPSEEADAGSLAGAGTAFKSTRVISRIAMILRVVRAILGMQKVSRVGSLVARRIRANASKGSRRYRAHGFDLDLTYVTSRVIAFAAPSFEHYTARSDDGEVFGLNDAQQMARFLAIRHYSKFLVYNLCGEALGDYPASIFFSQVERYHVIEKHPPTLSEILLFCTNATLFLLSDHRTVLAIHCSTGRDRTGVLCCSWLMFVGHCKTAQEALALFARRRSGRQNPDGTYQMALRGASLLRALRNVERLLKFNIPISATERVLRRVRCWGMTIFDSEQQTEDSNMQHGRDIVWNLPELTVSNDFVVYVLSSETRREGKGFFKRRSTRRVELMVSLHTGFVAAGNARERLVRDEIDFMSPDSARDFSDPELAMELDFSDQPTSMLESLRWARKMMMMHGRRESFDQGTVILDSGTDSRVLYLLVSGTVSQRVDETHGQNGSATTLGLLFAGDFFGFGAFFIGLPEVLHIASSDCVVMMLHLDEGKQLDGQSRSLREITSTRWSEADPLNDGATFERPELYRLEGFSAEDILRFFKTLSQFLAMQTAERQRPSATSRPAERSFNSHLDAQRRAIEAQALHKFRLPVNEACIHIQRCIVYDPADEVVGMRVIFLSNYIMIDQNWTGDDVSAADSMASKLTQFVNTPQLFPATALSSATDNYPDVQNLTIVLGGVEYECRCGTRTHAMEMLSKFHTYLNSTQQHLHRLMAEDRKHIENTTYMETLMAIAPKSSYMAGEVIFEEGSLGNGMVFVVEGSLSVMAPDGEQIVKVVGPSEFVGGLEYLLDISAQNSVIVRSTTGCDLVRLPKPLLDATLGSGGATAMSFYHAMAAQFASMLFSELLRRSPNAVFSTESHEAGTAKAVARELRNIKVLKLRKSDLLRALDDTLVTLLVRGSRSIALRKGQILMEQGEHVVEGENDCMYIVLTGQLSVHLQFSDADKAVLVDILKAGDAVGEMALLVDTDRSATVIAESDSEILEISKEVFKHVISLDNEVVRMVDTMVQERLERNTKGKRVFLAAQSASQPSETRRQSIGSSKEPNSRRPSKFVAQFDRRAKSRARDPEQVYRRGSSESNEGSREPSRQQSCSPVSDSNNAAGESRDRAFQVAVGKSEATEFLEVRPSVLLHDGRRPGGGSSVEEGSEIGMPTSVEGVGLPLEELNAPLQVAPIADEAIEAIEREKQEVIRSEQQRTVTQERTAEQARRMREDHLAKIAVSIGIRPRGIGGL